MQIDFYVLIQHCAAPIMPGRSDNQASLSMSSLFFSQSDLVNHRYISSIADSWKRIGHHANYSTVWINNSIAGSLRRKTLFFSLRNIDCGLSSEQARTSLASYGAIDAAASDGRFELAPFDSMYG